MEASFNRTEDGGLRMFIKDGTEIVASYDFDDLDDFNDTLAKMTTAAVLTWYGVQAGSS